MKKLYGSCAILWVAVLAGGCSPSQFIGQTARKEILQQPELAGAQVGISIYEPATARYLYNYQENKHFVPASNTKLFTLYAGLKYLGDSLVALRYRETDTALFVLPSGDPTFLHPDYAVQPAILLLQKKKKPVHLYDNNWQDQPLGRGWSWDDYNDDYMAERSSLPVYGNTIRWVEDSSSASFYSLPDINWPVRFTNDTTRKTFFVQRDRNENIFEITEGKESHRAQDVPFITNGLASAAILLKDTIGQPVYVTHNPHMPSSGLITLHSQPIDSLFQSMMYRSDNFFAEQTLLMVGNEHLGVMNDGKIIASLLQNDLKELPQRPVWVDGSGLSRYNLFTPQDFVWLLDKMSKEFGMNRMKALLPTNGHGTLGNYYKKDSGYVYAKTGSMSGVICISGYLYTKKEKLLIFSVLVNNNIGAGTVRRRVEHLLHTIRERY